MSSTLNSYRGALGARPFGVYPIAAGGDAVLPTIDASVLTLFGEMVSSGSGEMLVSGEVDATLETISLQTDIVIGLAGSVDAILQNVDLLGEGDVLLSGGSDAVLADLYGDLDVGVLVQGTLDKGFDDLFLEAHSAVLVQGMLTATLQNDVSLGWVRLTGVWPEEEDSTGGWSEDTVSSGGWTEEETTSRFWE